MCFGIPVGVRRLTLRASFCRKAVDSNALILTPADKAAEDSDVPEIRAPKLSKSQLRKQKKVQEEIIKREQRAQVCCSCMLEPLHMHAGVYLQSLAGDQVLSGCGCANAGIRYPAAACAVRFSTCPNHASTHARPVRNQATAAAPCLALPKSRHCLA